LKISVAIPTSALQDESLKIDKTRKISVLARACAIFKIETIYVYQEGNNGSDGSLMSMILKYLETPQFLRRRLFQKMNDLKFAGVLHPLKIPSHVTPSDAKKIVVGDIREGIIVSVKGKKWVDVGINQLLQFYGKTPTGKRVTIQFKDLFNRVKRIESIFLAAAGSIIALLVTVLLRM
jgi:predicted SPOUT superfamily RNA methylase MTH1